MTHILLADDDTELCELLTEYLSMEGFTVTAVHNGSAAVAEVAARHYDLLTLDVMMPELNGLDALRQIRQTEQPIPVLMLTARGDEVDRIVGLELGADDYLAKPCNPRELVARIRAILRRSQPVAAPTIEQDVQLGDLELQPATRRVQLKGADVELTGTEFNLLQELLTHAGQVLSKAALTETVLERKLTRYDRSIDMHISNLRKKLGSHADGEPRIKSVRGAGYVYTHPTQHKHD